MPSRQDPSALTAILGYLACPACLGVLQIAADRITCVRCGRTYPVVDGIPRLISDSLEHPASGTVS